MAGGMYNTGMRRLVGGSAGAVNWVTATNIKVMLLSASVAYTFNPDHEFVSSVAASEASGTGYVPGYAGAGRKLLTGKLILDDLTGDRVVFKCDTPITWTALQLSSGAITHVVVFVENGSDAASPLLALLDPADLTTNGGDVSLNFPSGEVFYLQQVTS
jgi:hypothetical protein